MINDNILHGPNSPESIYDFFNSMALVPMGQNASLYVRGLQKIISQSIPSVTQYAGMIPLDKDFSTFVPEFMVINKPSGDQYLIKRLMYTANNLFCCTQDKQYYVDVLTLYTCDPSTKDFNYATCDSTMLNFCNKSNIGTPKCLRWLYYSASRPLVYNTFYTYCLTNLFTKECEVFINSIRGYNMNDLADSILDYNKNDSRLSCSYGDKPNINSNIPYVCWSYDCINTPSYLLSYKDLVNRRRCVLYQCNIALTNVNISSDTKVNLSCDSYDTPLSLIQFAMNENPRRTMNFFIILILPLVLIFI